MNVLEIQQLSCQFGQQKVLDKLDLSLQENEIVCLLGASGCGKTTLLKAIAGLVPFHSGIISLANRRLNEVAIEAREIGFIFQDYALFPHLSVAENIQFGLKTKSSAEKQQICEKMLKLVKLDGLGNRYPHELSGGQQQRVAIARALACQPKLVLLDEPFSNIDSQTRYAMIQEIKQILKVEKVPAIFVTHSKEEAFAFADKIAVMDQGKIVQFGTAIELYQQPNSRFVAEMLGGVNYLKAEKIAEQCFKTALGEIEYAENVAQGTWLIRPEQLQLTPSEHGLGMIKARLFLGQYFSYQIQLAHGETLNGYNVTQFEINSRVNVEFIGESIVLLPY